MQTTLPSISPFEVGEAGEINSEGLNAGCWPTVTAAFAVKLVGLSTTFAEELGPPQSCPAGQHWGFPFTLIQVLPTSQQREFPEHKNCPLGQAGG